MPDLVAGIEMMKDGFIKEMVCVGYEPDSCHEYPNFKPANDAMPLHRNFIYWIDKRKWKYYFLMLTLQLAR